MTTTPLTTVADDLWTIEGDCVRLLTIPFGTRMTIARLGDGSLWLHSPVAPTPERLEAVAALGEVGHIVAPNKFHHLFVPAWAEHFPQARCGPGPGWWSGSPTWRGAAVLADEAPPEWADDLDQVLFGSGFFLPEVVFLHRASRTLVVTDIIQNHEPDKNSWFWRTVKRANHILAPNGGFPLDWRLTIRDREAARRARDRILGWDFDRLLITHGRCVDSGAHAFVERALAWLG